MEFQLEHIMMYLHTHHYRRFDITSMTNFNENIQTSISIKYDPFGVRIFMAILLFGDWSKLQTLSRDSSKVCRSTLSSRICSLLNTRGTSCSCKHLASLSHICRSSIVCDCCSSSSTPRNWSASPSTSPPLPRNWCGLPSRSAERRPTSDAMRIQRCFSYSAALWSPGFELENM